MALPDDVGPSNNPPLPLVIFHTGVASRGWRTRVSGGDFRRAVA